LAKVRFQKPYFFVKTTLVAKVATTLSTLLPYSFAMG